MLYFAYGSNLNHHQMKNIRCSGSKYIKTYILKDEENLIGYFEIIFDFEKNAVKLPILGF